jgi:hypothetical protein
MIEVPKIDPNEVFTIPSLTRRLTLKDGTLPREIRLRRIRYAKRAGKVLILGSWVLDWIREGDPSLTSEN